MRRVDADEFADHALRFLVSEEPVAVESNGRLLGIYHPVKRKDTEEAKRSMQQLEEAVQRILADTGMTEDELADLFDLTKPFPYDS